MKWEIRKKEWIQLDFLKSLDLLVSWEMVCWSPISYNSTNFILITAKIICDIA